MTQYLVIFNWHPCTLNVLLSCHWAKRGRLKALDRDLIACYALQHGTTPASGKRRVSLTITLAPRQRGCDRDAYWKSLLDALVHAGLLVNDSPKWCELGSVEYLRGKWRATTVTLEDV